MARFFVTWEIDVEAESPLDAARQAFAIMQKPGTSANCFKVFADDDSGDFVPVDLENEQLLADANSHYSTVQEDEIMRQIVFQGFRDGQTVSGF